MKKLFISQPMSGKADEEILAERKVAIKAAEELLREPVEVIDSFFQSAPVGAKPLWFIGKSLEFLSDADIAYFVKRTGRKQEDARSNMSVRLSMEFRELTMCRSKDGK